MMRLHRHDTPIEVAEALSGYAPRKLTSILDPAAGSGILLRPLTERLKRENTKVVCVDIDKNAITRLQRLNGLSLPSTTSYHCSDFIQWSESNSRRRFSCVIMNPPFAAGKSKLQLLAVGRTFCEGASKRYMPLEAAFVLRAIELLQSNGRLLAILPSSIITSDSMQWLRNLLLRAGAIRVVHELPPKCFQRVESRMYLLVFDKAAKQKQIQLLNHDLDEPERIDFPANRHSTIARLDFAFHRATTYLRRLVVGSEKLGWIKLGDVGMILRGDVESPLGSTDAVHTTSFDNGFWKKPIRRRLARGKPSHRILDGDILVKRVGRNSYRTFGLPLNLTGLSCSDCVLIIRPTDPTMTLQLLFALRALLAMGWTKPLVERGTGANYLSHEYLQQLLVPMGLSNAHPRLFASFSAAHHSRSAERSQEMLVKVSERLQSMLDSAHM